MYILKYIPRTGVSNLFKVSVALELRRVSIMTPRTSSLLATCRGCGGCGGHLVSQRRRGRGSGLRGCGSPRVDRYSALIKNRR